jgi:hypothetical protein
MTCTILKWLSMRDTANLSGDGDEDIGISGFRHDVDEICALLGYYTALGGSYVLTFQDNLWIPSSRVKKSKKEAG